MVFPQKDTVGSKKIPTILNHGQLENPVPAEKLGFSLPVPVPARTLDSCAPVPLQLQSTLYQNSTPTFAWKHSTLQQIPQFPQTVPYTGYTHPPPPHLIPPPPHLLPPPGALPPHVPPPPHLQPPPQHGPASYTFHVGNINYSLPPTPLPVPNLVPSGRNTVDQNSTENGDRKDSVVEEMFPKGKSPNIQGFLDKCQDQSFIGLEYVLEIQSFSGKKSSPSYSCRLCNIQYKAKEGVSCIDSMRQHLATPTHNYRYLAKHFPTVSKEYKLKSSTDDATREIVQRVEAKYGRMKVGLIIGTKLYKKKLTEIDQIIEKSQHFSENQEFLDELMGKKKKPKQTRNQGQLSDTIEISEFEGDAMNENQNKSQLPCGSKSQVKSKSRSPSVEICNIETRESGARHSRKTLERRQRSRTPESRKNRRKTPEARRRTPETRNRSKSRSGTPKARKRNRCRTPGAVKRSRSRTPIDATITSKRNNTRTFGVKERIRIRSPERKSRTPERRKRHKSLEDPCPLTDVHMEDSRREKFRIEREGRVKNFIEEEKEMQIALRTQHDTFKVDCFNHPLFQKEWGQFLERNFGYKKRVKMREMDRVMRMEWNRYWTKVLQQDHEANLQRETERLKRKYKILQRDLDEYASGQHYRASSPSSKGRKMNSSNCGRKMSSDSRERRISPSRSARRGSSPTVTSSDATMIETLKMLNGREQFLDDIGPEVNKYLRKALVLESKTYGSSEILVNQAECYRMLDLSMEKLRHKMGTGAIKEYRKHDTRICVNNIAILLQKSTCERQEILEIDARKHEAATVSKEQIKMMIAKSLSQKLPNEGRQLEKKEFEVLVEAEYIRVKNQLPINLAEDYPGSNDASSSNQILNRQLSQLFPNFNAPSSNQNSNLYLQQPYSAGNGNASSSKNANLPLTYECRDNPNPSLSRTSWGSSDQYNRPQYYPDPPNYSGQQENEPMILQDPALLGTYPNINWDVISSACKVIEQKGTGQPDNDKDDDDDIEILDEVKKEVGPIDLFDELTDDELIHLMTNFKELEQGEKLNLVDYVKKLQKKDRARAIKLKTYM